jgi:RND superfamily putative drug exporter
MTSAPPAQAEQRVSTPEPAPRVGPLGRLARLTYRNRGRTVLAWLAVLVLAVVLSTAFGGKFKADYSAPGSDSKAAQQPARARFPAESGDTVDVVVHSEAAVTSAAVRGDVATLLAKVAGVPHVATVEDPYAAPGNISADGHTLVAHARLDVVNPPDMPVKDSQRLLDIADSASTNGLAVALGGQSIQQAEQGPIGSEGLGVAAAPSSCC